MSHVSHKCKPCVYNLLYTPIQPGLMITCNVPALCPIPFNKKPFNRSSSKHQQKMSSLISPKTLALIQFYSDSITALCTILIGRLLPILHIPKIDLTNKIAIVTGANSGIGYSLALSLATQNATVYLACRTASKAREAASQIIDACGDSNRVHILALDTSSLASVRAFAETWGDKPIDLLIHNAGITGPPGNQHTTPEGLGTIYATNFAGSFLLTSLLEPNLSPSARVIFTSSTAQYGARPHRIFSLPRLAPQIDAKTSKPTDSSFYADTKFMQSALAHLLQKRFSSSSSNNKRTAHSFVPGYTYTPIFDKTPALPWYMDPFFWALKACTFICIPVDQGAAPGLWLATTEDERVVGEGRGGECWDRCVKRSTAADVLSERTLERMWKQWEVDVEAEWA
jgi:NAD(P)-dependent dehydrogenase (short-subunit alcohol dehydrogenase family)